MKLLFQTHLTHDSKMNVYGSLSAESSTPAAGGTASSRGLLGHLNYSVRRAQDYGTVECSANNSIGQQKVPCIFVVRPPSMFKTIKSI